ncbi:hypothetical protein NQD34_007471 [Periophthalmus magnuspinnatus]|nr:hypothetical protein NQD34_007471 [Periophthalmus magnuspinnatus]
MCGCALLCIADRRLVSAALHHGIPRRAVTLSVSILSVRNDPSTRNDSEHVHFISCTFLTRAVSGEEQSLQFTTHSYTKISFKQDGLKDVLRNFTGGSHSARLHGDVINDNIETTLRH